jgi:hypothetical protein
MKNLIILLIILIFSASCKKEEQRETLPEAPLKVTKNITLPKLDTIANDAMLRIKLCKDSINTDETALMFKSTASVNYVNNEDARYFPGFGQVSLSSISGDGKNLAINCLPFTAGMSIGLDVETKTDGAYLLKVSYESDVPQSVQVWIRDSYLKDSVDLCQGNYQFNVTKADSATFGKKRFSVVLKENGQ